MHYDASNLPLPMPLPLPNLPPYLFERIGSYWIVGFDHQPVDRYSELGQAPRNLARVVLERYIVEHWIIELDDCERFSLLDTRYFTFGCRGSMIVWGNFFVQFSFNGLHLTEHFSISKYNLYKVDGLFRIRWDWHCPGLKPLIKELIDTSSCHP